MNSVKIANLPDHIGFDATVFSTMNLTIMVLLLVFLPLTMYWIGKKANSQQVTISNFKLKLDEGQNEVWGMEKLTYARWFAFLTGGIILFYAIRKAIVLQEGGVDFTFINPNYINLLLLGVMPAAAWEFCPLFIGGFESNNRHLRYLDSVPVIFWDLRYDERGPV